MFYLDLSGEWECRPAGKQPIKVQVPGCFDTHIEEKDFADEVTFTTIFMLEKSLPYYRLCFGAVSYYCEVWLNDIHLGNHEGMWDRFDMDASAAIRQGENTLKVVVTKPGYKDTDRFPLRQVLSGFLPDVICTFGGLWEKPCLMGADSFFVQNHFARGNGQGQYDVEVQIFAAVSGAYRLEGRLLDCDGNAVGDIISQPVQLGEGCHSLKAEGLVKNPRLWSMDAPVLYAYEITVQGPGQTETLKKAFGFRDIASEGSKILLNGHAVYPRGVLHWGYYSEQIVPRPSREEIREEIQRCKAYGFNLIKHCLYIPSPDYFELADEMGMLLWVELPLWLPDPTPALEHRVRREYPAIVKQIAGHPSIVMMSLGCELNDSVEAGILEEMYTMVKQESRALVRDNSGSGECYGGHTVDYADFFDYHFYGELQNMENLMEVFTPGWRSRRPWLFGEYCDSDTMRDLTSLRQQREVEKMWWEEQNATTNPISILKPDFYAGTYDARLEQSGIRKDFDAIFPLSLKHTMAHRKTTMEQTRSFPEISGYIITCIRDVPIAASGIFDNDMNDKFDCAEFDAFNRDVVLLPAWDLGREWIGADRVSSRERYNFIGGSEFGLHVLLSNYSRSDIEGGEFCWCLKNQQGEITAQGKESVATFFTQSSVEEAYYLVFPLPEVTAPATYSLQVAFEWPDGEASNEWPVFLYPQTKAPEDAPQVYDPCNLFGGLQQIFPDAAFVSTPEELKQDRIVFTSLWTPALRDFVEQGGRVFCIQRGKGLLPTQPMPFWREGMLRAYPHPILEGCMPTHNYDDLRYFSLGTDSAIDETAMAENGFISIAPIIHRYDCRQWTRHSYIGEFSCGKGRLIATTLRFEGGMGKQPISIDKSPFACHLARRIFAYLCTCRSEE